MDTKVLLIGGGLAALALYLFKKKNEDKNNAKNSDNETADLTDKETQQALQIQAIIEPFQMLGQWTTKNLYGSTADSAKLLNILLECTDWAKLQKKFRALCNNEYTLNSALQSALPDDYFKKAIEIAAAKKVVTTKSCTAYLYEGSNTLATTKNFQANTILGALKSKTAYQTFFINGFKSSGAVITDLVEVSGYVTGNDNIKLI